MDYKDLANLIFPDAKEISYYEEKYPERNLPEGAVVTRFAPSPTGFVHIGGLYQALVARTVAEKTGGVFFLRVEDTDQKREVENGVTGIVNSLKDFDMAPDEGMISDTEEIGNYGPYKQSLRKEIYQAYAKYLLEQGKAYPCFCTPDDLEEIRNKQEAAKLRTGYYGVWAKCRNLSVEEMAEKVKAGEPYIIRFKSPGREDRKIKHKDVIKGNVDFPENDQDIIIIKSDGLPTYHFAHAVDDHLMHTTHVIRSDEWLSSVPLHLQLFHELGFKAPKYAHISPIMKNDNGGKRKLSKTGKIFLDILLVICLCVAGYSGWKIYSTLHEYKTEENGYKDLSKQVVSTSTPVSESEEVVPFVSIDWNALQSKNSDIAGWIRQDNTVIDFPVVYGSDNEYYLRHTLEGEYSLFGTLFVDYRNQRNFTDKVTVIYGHHFSEFGDTMFTSLEKYSDQSYYDEHKQLELYTPEGNYVLYPIAGSVKEGTDNYIRTAFESDEDFYNYCNSTFLQSSTFTSEQTLESGDRCVLLSTCTDLVKDGRYALLCKLTPIAN